MQTTETEPIASTTRARAWLGTGELTEKLSRNELFDVLSNERRRCALYYLQQQEGTVELTDVVDYVTAWQYGESLSELDSGQRMRVYSALHQAHLPKLDSAGFIDYDSENGTIETREEVEYARLYLEYDPENDISWSTLYFGLVAIGVTLALVSRFAVGPFDWLTSSHLVWLLLLLFGLTTLALGFHEWRNKLALAELFEINR